MIQKLSKISLALAVLTLAVAVVVWALSLPLGTTIVRIMSALGLAGALGAMGLRILFGRKTKPFLTWCGLAANLLLLLGTFFGFPR